ncbi:dihydroneopterin aldolase [Aquisalimonas asiatica]|uniref:7,8-dihydroneopterin aldolase n=1 Tax=Aquisalimonas asiatica TaxID=406100 RepID=A0A1H8V6K6_9GAMM|nr:dihydroneopterin aldolase [Aquisalimonas asiatica]SEP10917.1 dihydroneopterin aldolase [Aquisalimonas asiatica]
MDIVFINELRIDTVIGVRDWERRVRQTLVLDLELAADTATAAESDDVGDALDYDAVTRQLTEHVRDMEHALVETLAEDVAMMLRDEFGIPWLRLRVTKPGAVPGARAVGVVIERGQWPGAA